MGVDIAGTVVRPGPGAEGFSVGDQVFAMADNTYAELCVVKADVLVRVLKGLDLIEAAALPLVTTTGNQLASATGIKTGQTVLVAGAAGNVGRSTVFTAKQLGATVIAGVLKRQMEEAKSVGADRLVATDDDDEIANLPLVDAVAAVYSTADRKTLEFMAEAARDGKLVIPIGPKFPLSQAAEAQAAAEKGGIGKVLLLA
jgi:NADPH:quinone reductase-like Zn-dependent oxidoreductase